MSCFVQQNVKIKLFNEHFKTFGTSRMSENKNEMSIINERAVSRLKAENYRSCYF